MSTQVEGEEPTELRRAIGPRLYLELVTKYPTAAGAALYAHRAFGIHVVTFLVAFTVMASGITSASTASKALAANLVDGVGADTGSTGLVLAIAVGFMLLVAAVNVRGVGESVRANVVLTCIELSGLLLVVLVGVYAATAGKADFSRAVVSSTPRGTRTSPSRSSRSGSWGRATPR